jgi:hypothetical protein
MRRLSKSFSARAQRAGGRCRYFALFGLQTIGAVIILWNEVSHYRQAIPATPQARPETLIRSLSAIAMIQTGYWISYRAQPPPPQITNALIGHVLSFIGRVGFVFACVVLGFVFVTQNPEFHLAVFPYIVILAALFSLYCYLQEMERWAMLSLVETLLGRCPVIVDIGLIARDYSMSRRRQGRYQASFFAGTAP